MKILNLAQLGQPCTRKNKSRSKNYSKYEFKKKKKKVLIAALYRTTHGSVEATRAVRCLLLFRELNVGFDRAKNSEAGTDAGAAEWKLEGLPLKIPESLQPNENTHTHTHTHRSTLLLVARKQ